MGCLHSVKLIPFDHSPEMQKSISVIPPWLGRGSAARGTSHPDRCAALGRRGQPSTPPLLYGTAGRDRSTACSIGTAASGGSPHPRWHRPCAEDQQTISCPLGRPLLASHWTRRRGEQNRARLSCSSCILEEVHSHLEPASDWLAEPANQSRARDTITLEESGLGVATVRVNQSAGSVAKRRHHSVLAIAAAVGRSRQ